MTHERRDLVCPIPIASPAIKIYGPNMVVPNEYSLNNEWILRVQHREDSINVSSLPSERKKIHLPKISSWSSSSEAISTQTQYIRYLSFQTYIPK